MATSNGTKCGSAKNGSFDLDYLQRLLLRLLHIHSPTGYTDPIVHEVCKELKELQIPFELTRRGAIRATLRGLSYSPDRAVVTHLDTLGAMVRQLKPNGRLALVPVGTWSSRFAEGARVSVFTDDTIYRGTILPNLASGHVYNDEVDRQPTGWDHVELRVDERCDSKRDLQDLGINVGDFVGIDSQAECMPNGFINARHLDNKAGVAAMLTAAKFIIQNEVSLPTDCHLLFTISEEVGSGASAVLHGDVGEMVSVDNGTVAPGQNSSEHGVTIAIGDSSGPFDYHLTHHLIHLCQNHSIPFQRDVFRYYRCDSAAAVEAGNDIRTALMTFGVDASHGYERTHIDALDAVAALLVAYASSKMIYRSEKRMTDVLENFPRTRKVDLEHMVAEQRDAVKQLPTQEAPSPSAAPLEDVATEVETESNEDESLEILQSRSKR